MYMLYSVVDREKIWVIRFIGCDFYYSSIRILITTYTYALWFFFIDIITLPFWHHVKIDHVYTTY